MEATINLPSLTEDELCETRVALRTSMAHFRKWAEKGPKERRAEYMEREIILYSVYQKFGGERILAELRKEDALP